MGLFQRLKG